MSEKLMTRRELLKSAAAVAAFTIVPRHVLGGPGYTPPSERLTRAVVGVGGMGMWHVGMEGSVLLALADVDSRHLQNGLDRAAEKGNRPAPYRDFREVLDRTDIDVIHNVTPPHWHALVAIMAAQAGKDIWSEKPMTRTIGEGRSVVDTVQRTGRIFRVNTFVRLGDDWYSSGMKTKEVKKLVTSGVFGSPLKFTIGKSTGFDWKLDQWSGVPGLRPEPVPAELDYDMWLGPAPYKPYNVLRVHEKFRGYWDYDGGGLGDMGQHYLDPAQYVLGKDNTSPVEVEADAPQQHPDAVGNWRTIRMRYADGTEILLDGTDSKRDDVPVIEGPLGKLYKDYKSTIPDLQKMMASLPDPEPLLTDFYDCVRTRRKHALNEDVSHRACILVNLAKAAVQSGRKLRFDPLKQVFVNDEEANRLINEPMRGPWHV